MIRNDRIDILVNLTMHMAHNRLLAFAHKPDRAGVLACLSGHHGPWDNRLPSPPIRTSIRRDSTTTITAEESIRLADTFWCYDPLSSEPVVNALPGWRRAPSLSGASTTFAKSTPLS